MTQTWPTPVPLSPSKTHNVRRWFVNGTTMFRGARPGRPPSDPGDLGVGTYFSSLRSRAANYGHVTVHVISLKNPLVLSTDVAYDIVAEQFMTCRGPFRKTGAEAATRVMRCLGFDGVVAVRDGGHQAEELEVCVFP